MFSLCWHGRPEIQINENAERFLRLNATALLIGVALVVLTAPVAQAQTSPEAVAPPEVEGEGRYLVTFALDSVTLTAQDRQVIAQAAEDYRAGGAPQISVTGYTDTSGPAEYNLVLSQQRAETVADALIQEGVPATDIVTSP